MLTKSKSLITLLAILGAAISGCANNNSNSDDREQYGDVTLDTGDPRFLGAYQILSAKCNWCHTHSSWAGYTSDEQWISHAKVIKNDSANSPIILQIQSGSMPQSGTISAAETQQLMDWIDQMP